MTTLQIPTAEVYEPLLAPARYKGAWGGRGSGKSHFFADLLIRDSMLHYGLLSVCIREVQKDLRESAKRLIEAKLEQHGLGAADGFEVLRDCIRTPGGGQIIFQGMTDHTAESIKSLEGYRRAWIEEAHTLSSRSLKLLRPTIRADGSELWFGWNPRRRQDAVDALFRAEALPTGAVVVKANWRDNPWFPDTLRDERRDCLRDQPDEYDHIWEGGYEAITAGAYYAKQIREMRAENRLCRVGKDPMMTIRAYWDIGGTGAKADACAIWIAQFVNREIRVLSYYEAQGQPLAAHVEWLRSNGYGKALCVLPHDGATNDRVHDVSYESFLRSAGFDVEVIPNQGKGAANMRIEATRRQFSNIWMNEATTVAGLEAAGAYHANIDEKRGIDLGPVHNWASHGADALGLMCVHFQPPAYRRTAKPRPSQSYMTA